MKQVVWWMVTIILFCVIIGGGGGYVGYKIGSGNMSDLLRTNDGFRDTIQRQRDANLELATANADLESLIEADAEGTRQLEALNKELKDRNAELAIGLAKADGYIVQLEDRVGGANREIGKAIDALTEIESIIDSIEGGERDTP